MQFLTKNGRNNRFAPNLLGDWCTPLGTSGSVSARTERLTFKVQGHFQVASRSKRERCCRSCRPFVHAVKLSILWWTLCQCLWLLCLFVRETLSHCHCHFLYSLVLTTKCYNIFTIPSVQSFDHFENVWISKSNISQNEILIHILIHYGQSKWRLLPV